MAGQLGRWSRLARMPKPYARLSRERGLCVQVVRKLFVRVGCACVSHHPPHYHGPEPALGAEVRELMSKAFKGPLIPTQQQQVLAELEADSRLVYHCGLTPQKVGAGLATT